MLIAEKIAQSIELLKEFDIDCWLTVTRESSISGDPALPFLIPADVTWHSAIIITNSGRAETIVGRYDAQTIEDLGVYDAVTGYVTSFREPFLETMKKLGPKKIAVNYSKDSETCDGLTHGMYLTLVEYLEEIGMADRLVSAERIVSALRERKCAFEIDSIRKAIAAANDIFSAVRSFIKPGKTEREIAAFMQAEMNCRKLSPAWSSATCPSVFTGPNTAQAHYGPSDRQVERGHVLNMDFGVKVNGYCCDMQRSFYILREGETEAPVPVRKGFDIIVQAIDAALAMMKPGIQGIMADTAARAVVTQAGYEEFPHALGHQIGRFAHDGTALLGPAWDKYGRRPFQKIEKNMVFAVEPRLPVEGHGIVTVEDNAVIKENGAAWLGEPQKELLLIS